MKLSAFLTLSCAVLLLLPGCSPSKFAIDMTIDALTGEGSAEVFSGDSDPVLVGDALPFALKMYESLLVSRPEHTGLLSVTGSAYVSYANAFCHLPAGMEESWREQDRQLRRAVTLYLRGRDYSLRALEVRHPGFSEALGKKEFETLYGMAEKDDVEEIYWAAAGWFGAIAAEGFNMRRMQEISSAYALLIQALALDESYQKGAVHDLLISVLPSAPKELRYRADIDPALDIVRRAEENYFLKRNIGNPPLNHFEAALHHFERSIELNGGNLAGTFVAYAESVTVPMQDYGRFKELLLRALDVDIDRLPDSRLVNTLQKEKAAWLLEHADDYFLIIGEGE
jgi:predicted anti-sigma-YlaC factor YlaD